MPKPTITIRQATSDDIEKVTQFRIDQFKTAKEFEVVSTELFSVMKGQVLIAELDNEIISTMQFQTLSNRQELVRAETSYIPDNFDGFETFYLSKGATSREFRNTGINSYLRMVILKYAVVDNKINSLTGTAYNNAPRMNVLKRIGYNMIETYNIVHDYLKAKDNPQFIWLDRVKFANAVDLLEVEIEELKSNYEIINEIVSKNSF
jgi:hypothetical protein